MTTPDLNHFRTILISLRDAQRFHGIDEILRQLDARTVSDSTPLQLSGWTGTRVPASSPDASDHPAPLVREPQSSPQTIALRYRIMRIGTSTCILHDDVFRTFNANGIRGRWPRRIFRAAVACRDCCGTSDRSEDTARNGDARQQHSESVSCHRQHCCTRASTCIRTNP